MTTETLSAPDAHLAGSASVPPTAAPGVAARQPGQRVRAAVASVPFLAMHLSPLLLIWTDIAAWAIALCIGSYYLRMFGVTAGYHRYFSHRSYKVGRVTQFLLACLAQTSAQKGALWWAAHHRHHHRHSDHEDDVHSPVMRTIWHAHVGWLFEPRHQDTDFSKIKDLASFPELRWLNRYHLVPAIAYAALLFLLFGWTGFVWGFLISTVLLWHGTFLVNSATHLQGKRVYETTDASRNNWWVSIFTLGEGWHNNHHFYQRSTAQGWRWYEFDPTFTVLKVMERLGLARGVSLPPAHIVAKRIDRLPAPDAAAARRLPPRMRNGVPYVGLNGRAGERLRIAWQHLADLRFLENLMVLRSISAYRPAGRNHGRR